MGSYIIKKIIFIFTLALLFSINVSAVGFDDILGQWHGLLKEHGVYLKITLNVQKTGNEYLATLESPSQKAGAVALTSIIFENQSIKFKIIELAVEYKGALDKDGIIKGVFEQRGQAFTVNFSRDEITKPQEPSKPYPYKEEEIYFKNEKADITLAGTLTMPYGHGPFCTVVLISGSGPQNRDEEIVGHKPFLVIADYLTKKGFAVLRYDDRGAGSSTGDFKSATTEDFAADAKSAVQYLENRKEVNKNKIGLIGHSEGAIVASMIASEQKNIAFTVLLAGSGVPGKNIILEQIVAVGKASKKDKKELKREAQMNREAMKILSGHGNYGQVRNSLAEYAAKIFDNIMPSDMPKGVGKTDFMRAYINTYANSWMRFFVNYDPAYALERVKCPVLALGGSKDLQINADKNLKAIKKAVSGGGNKDVTVKLYPGLNHLFQESKTGLPFEYALIDQTFSPAVLSEMTEWMENKIK